MKAIVDGNMVGLVNDDFKDIQQSDVVWVERIDDGVKSAREIRERIDTLRERLADVYGKNMPYEEERLQARIAENSWVLGGEQP